MLTISSRWGLRNQYVALKLCVVSATISGRAAIPIADMAKAPHEVWERLARGKAQDQIVVFDDSTARKKEVNLRQNASGAVTDEAFILLKGAQYAVLKKAVLSTMPVGEVEVFKDYDMLPLMFLRFRTQEALKALLVQPFVLRVYEDRREPLLPRIHGVDSFLSRNE